MSLSDMVFDGAFASACATVISNPFDVVRTRMQLQGEMKKAGEYEVIYKNLFQAMGKMAKDEGALSLQKGLVPAVLWQMALNGVRIGSYPVVKTEIGHFANAVQQRYFQFREVPAGTNAASIPLSESYSFLICVLSGAICGVIGAFVSSPFALVKTRLQSDSGASLAAISGAKTASTTSAHMAAASTSTGTQFHYKGVFDGLKKIYKKGGVKGLWHGSSFSAQRTMFGSAAQLTSYDYCRTHWAHLLGYSVSDARIHILAAISASVFVVIFMNPFDVVSTRSYNTHLDVAGGTSHQAGRQSAAASANMYRQVFAIYRVEGLYGMYKGSIALFARTAPHSVATFVVLEWVRKMRETHLPSRAYTKGSNLSNDNNNNRNNKLAVKLPERGTNGALDRLTKEELMTEHRMIIANAEST